MWVLTTTMYLHSPNFLLGLQFPAWVPITTMYLHSLHFPARALSPPPCTYIPCVSLHGSLCGSQHYCVTTFPAFNCMGSIPCVGDLFVHLEYCAHYLIPTLFSSWVPTTTMYLHSPCSFCGINFLHG